MSLTRKKGRGPSWTLWPLSLSQPKACPLGPAAAAGPTAVSVIRTATAAARIITVCLGFMILSFLLKG